jgi:Cap4 SAVED domain
VKFHEWCESKDEVVNAHNLRLLVLRDGEFDGACKLVCNIIPNHYASPERVAAILDKLGKEKAAAYLREKLPQNPKIRSGDLGEILATQYIDDCTDYKAPIKRLRWKDHREMAMRGDDVIAIGLPTKTASLRLLKTEVKSRTSLSAKVVKEARLALNSGGGLPSPHALAFVSDRLHELGQDTLADLISLAQLKDGISEKQVQHLIFAFCGNKPDAFLKTDLENYKGSIQQNAVGMCVTQHQKFITAVYETTGVYESR